MKEIKKLINGYERFHQDYFVENPDLYQDLFQGQSPKFLIISCCDSRVHPAQIMSTEPGDIFVIRNVANLVPINEDDGKSHGTSAAMEFAIKHLKVRHVIIMGHSQCGGIKALMEGDHGHEDYGFIDPWMKNVTEAREAILSKHGDKSFDEQCAHCEKEAIGISLKNIMTFPWVKERVDTGNLFAHGWYFDIGSGSLLGKEGVDFKPINELSIN